MNMAIRDIFRLSRKTFFNPAGWIDFDLLKEHNRTIFDVLRNAFVPPQPEREETFEEAMARLKLTKADLVKRIKTYRQYTLFFACLGLLCSIYAFFLIFSMFSIT